MSINQSLFYWINQDGGNHYVWLDQLMLFLSRPTASIIPLAAVVAYVLIKDRSRWRILLGMVIAIGLDDWVGGQIKHYFAVVRPCEALDGVRLLLGCGPNSFPSNHAANTAAFALYVALFYRRTAVFIWLIPFFVGISRIYVGVHYPVDVIGGWVLGCVIAVIAYNIHIRIIYPKDSLRPESTG